MPSSLLFAINNEGRVYVLSTAGSLWREFMYLGLEFKQLSAIPHFLWAVGGDRQIYVHVHGLEIPIRVKEEAYENERWLPLEGFSGRLLPTDRYHFSTKDGSRDRSIDRIRLPSMAWQWEGDWQLELSLDGQPLDHDGWSYAVDFPAQYGPTKQWKSCVRRRKWVRNRRYSALNSWCAIAPLHKDPTQEPFIDVSIGGHQVPNGIAGSLSVWAITAHGRVMFRSGACTTAPEGLRWTNIAVPPGCEVKQISVGTSGLVWVLLWTGRALVRKGVTRDCPMGDSWLEVKAPDDTKLCVITVGCDAVWSVSTDGRVWFRKGISGAGSGTSETLAMGKGWLEIGGNMAHISVAANDQVFGVGALDRCVYWRCGVNPAELTGKNWRLVQAPLHLSRASSNASLIKGSPRGRHRSLNSLNRPLSAHEAALPPGSWEESSRSAPAPRTLPLRPPLLTSATPPTSDSEDTCSIKSNSQQGAEASDGMIDVSVKCFETTLKNPRAWSPVRSVGSVVGMEAHPETDSSVFDTDSGMFGDDESDHAALYWDECDAVWTLVEAGGCTFDPTQLPHWFADSHSVPQVELTQAWRLQILDDLKGRLQGSDIEVSSYEKAVDTKSWVRSGEARCFGGSGKDAEDCLLALECHSGSSGGTLTILNPDGATTKHNMILSEITCVVSCSEAGCPRIAIYAPRRFKSPLKIQFASDTDQEEWLSLLVDVICQVHDVSGRPSSEALWGATAAGDVLVWDPQSWKVEKQDNSYIQEMDVFGKDTTNVAFSTTLHNSFPAGTELEISGCLHDVVERISINLEGHPRIKIKHKKEKDIRDVALHFNPRFKEGFVVRNTMKEGDWGEEERDSSMNLVPGQDFNIKIVSHEKGYDISTNGQHFTFYKHRIKPETVASLQISGPLRLFRIVYKSKSVIISNDEMVWRCMGGHLRRVESCSKGVVWGIAHDHTPWLYTGGWGGPCLKVLDKHKDGINPMTDTQNYFVYENQRWNPLSGYTGSGLPTDRYMWSDSTGKHKRTRELTKLLNRHWHWVSDWIVDFHAPGGVDRDGWQYATDFPSTYHGRKLFTDCVRRRRWFRRAQLNTSGPWHELGNTKILDLSLWSEDTPDSDEVIGVWAIAATGDALFRTGVTKETPGGSSWEHVTCTQPLVGISVGGAGVWAVGRKGEAYWRMGIIADNPIGTLWHVVESIPGMGSLKQLSVGSQDVWAVDSHGKIIIRKEITAATPAGSNWLILGNDAPDGTGGFRHISVGEKGVWAVSTGGTICRRAGISETSTTGSGWVGGITAAWLHISARGKSL